MRGRCFGSQKRAILEVKNGLKTPRKTGMKGRGSAGNKLRGATKGYANAPPGRSADFAPGQRRTFFLMACCPSRNRPLRDLVRGRRMRSVRRSVDGAPHPLPRLCVEWRRSPRNLWKLLYYKEKGGVQRLSVRPVRRPRGVTNRRDSHAHEKRFLCR